MDGGPAARLTEGYPIALSPDGNWVHVVRTHGGVPSALVPTGAGEEKPFLIDGMKPEIVEWLPEETYLVCADRRLYPEIRR
jgi:hypothetical protein